MNRITEHYLCWVAPFGYLRINACLRLPVAFRSLLRPSSALGAKASTVCPYYLDFSSALALGRAHAAYAFFHVASSMQLSRYIREKKIIPSKLNKELIRPGYVPRLSQSARVSCGRGQFSSGSP